jgi:hypothetical protein
MIVDAEKIIQDTKDVFFRSEIQKKNFSKIKDFVNETDYKRIHKTFLTPLKINIDVDLFLTEIEQYSRHFEKWGSTHSELPRYGLALVNQDGKLKSNDPINGSLYEWNEKHPDHPIIESDCKLPTEVIQLKSLTPLSVFHGMWYRSNILKWESGAEFKPHIDTVLPSPWFRLWGTTDSKNTVIRFCDHNTKTMKDYSNIESGRIYLIDTSVVHDAYSTGDVYQFFLSVNVASSNKLESLICNE